LKSPVFQVILIHLIHTRQCWCVLDPIFTFVRAHRWRPCALTVVVHSSAIWSHQVVYDLPSKHTKWP
jgi:hypothetical protein